MGAAARIPSSHRWWQGSAISSVKAYGRQPSGQRPAKAPARRGASGSSPGAPAHRKARRVAPRRNRAPGRSAPAGPGGGLTPATRRAEPARQAAVSEGATLASVRRSWERIRPARTTSAARPLANAATVAARNSPPGGPDGDQAAKVTGPMRRGFAQVTG